MNSLETMVGLFEVAWGIVGGILFPLGIEFSLRSGAGNGFPLVSKAKLPTVLKGLAYLFSTLAVLNAAFCAYESDTRIAVWALVLGYGIAGSIFFRRSSVLKEKTERTEPNQRLQGTPESDPSSSTEPEARRP